MEEKLSFEATLSEVSARLPNIGSFLAATHSNRAENLRRYSEDARLKGVDELLGHLKRVHSSLVSAGHQEDLGFIVERSIADFEVALEAGLSGLLNLAHEAMRDVMEIEFLLREVAAVPEHLDQWLNATPDELRTNFSANRLRQLHANRLGIDVTELPEHTDYKGQSIALHFTPWTNPMTRKGLVREDLTFGSDMAFWELFFHARRFLFALHEVLAQPRFEGVTNPDPETDLPLVRDAFERTQEMQILFFALMGIDPTKLKHATSEG